MDGEAADVFVGQAGHRYRWHEDWASLEDDDRRRRGWAHHALVTSRDGSIIGFHPADGTILVMSPDGQVDRALDCGVVEGHGMSIVVEGGDEFLWIADAGVKLVPSAEGPTGYAPTTMPGGVLPTHGSDRPAARVVKIRLDDGRVVSELPWPEHELYSERPYIPTAVAVAPNGDVWVADGYGASLLHRFTGDGTLARSLTGDESAAGRLRVPHGLLVDRRRDTPELLVADRENRRLVAFDLEGEFLRAIAPGVLERPCAMAIHEELLVVAELRARVSLLDLDDQLVQSLGGDETVADQDGWPNGLDGSRAVRPRELAPGRFHSPHGITTDADGNLYVTEWLIGGRYTKLTPASNH